MVPPLPSPKDAKTRLVPTAAEAIVEALIQAKDWECNTLQAPSYECWLRFVRRLRLLYTFVQSETCADQGAEKGLR